MKTQTRILLTILTAIMVFCGFFGWIMSRSPAPIAFIHIPPISATNGGSVTIGITNQSDRVIHYILSAPQIRSNGFWPGVPFPIGQSMSTLQPGGFATRKLPAGSLTENVRTPLYWSFDYMVTTSRWAEVKEELFEKMSGNNPGGRGAIYTNYLTDALTK